MALSAGSIAFVGYDADGTLRLAVIAVDDLPGGTVIRLTDRRWDGSSFQSGSSEGTLTWTVPAGGIARGTLVSFDDVNNIPTGSPTGSSSYIYAERNGVSVAAGTVERTGGFDTEQSNEVLYAYTGPINTPTTFLSAIANDGFTSGNGVLTGTGLTAGSTAVNLGAVDADADFGVYQPPPGSTPTAPRTQTFISRSQMLSTLNNPGNWLVLDTSADDSSGRVPFLTDTDSPIHNVTFVFKLPTPVFQPTLDQQDGELWPAEVTGGETFTFTAHPGSTVSVTFSVGTNSIPPLTAVEGPSGTFTVTLDQGQLEGLGLGTLIIKAQATDPAGWAAPSDWSNDTLEIVPCFLTGTRIATPSGEVAVEALRAGDAVLLADGRSAEVRWVGHQVVPAGFARLNGLLPVRIQAGALGEGLPKRDLLVSPGHAIGFGDALVNAGALVNGTTIREETAMPPRFTYWHVELAEHALLLAEGVPAESFLDTLEPMRFDNGAERPDFPPVEEMDLPRASSRRQVPRRIRALVAERAAALAATDAAAA